MIQDFLRGVHQAEQRLAQGGRQHGKHNAQHAAEHHRVPDAAADFRFILRAEGLGDRNGKTGAQAETQADDKEVHGTRRADGSQPLRPEEAADNRRVHKAVELLEQHAEEHRQREEDNQFQGAALCQVAGHGPGHTG